MKRAALAFAVALCGCSPGQPAVQNGSATATQAPNGYALRSNVSGASLVRVADLPRVKSLPPDPSPDGYCEERYVKPVTSAGKLAARRGWRVRQEERFHQFEAVLIVRGLDQLTSGRCRGVDANVAFFEGERLVGILYPKGKDGLRIDSLEVVDDHLRIWSEDPAAQGQIDLNGPNLSFDPITGSDAVCNGRYRVPAVFGLSYAEARQKLMAAGWRPLPSKEELYRGDDGEARRRFPELDSCAGTGYGECGFTMVAKDGVTALSITTLGDIEDAGVSSYSVACGGKPEQRLDGA